MAEDIVSQVFKTFADKKLEQWNKDKEETSDADQKAEPSKIDDSTDLKVVEKDDKNLAMKRLEENDEKEKSSHRQKKSEDGDEPRRSKKKKSTSSSRREESRSSKSHKRSVRSPRSHRSSKSSRRSRSRHRSRSKSPRHRSHKSSRRSSRSRRRSGSRKGSRNRSPFISEAKKLELLEIAKANVMRQYQADATGQSLSASANASKMNTGPSIAHLTEVCKDIAHKNQPIYMASSDDVTDNANHKMRKAEFISVE